MAVDTASPPLVGRPVIRVSKDKSGRETSPEDQLDDLTLDAEEQGITLGEVYRDVGSASRHARNRKGRQDFDRLVADLKDGTFGAELVMLWEPSRGGRLMSEWLRLLELCEAAAVRFWVHTAGRVLDPRRADDRKWLLEAAIDSEHEVAKLSGRVRRGMQKAARRGKPHGSIPPGYRRIYDAETGKYVEQVRDPDLAPLVEELFERVEARQSLRGIVRDWDARGVRNASGRPYTQQHVRDWLVNRAYIGERVHDPNRRGRKLSVDAVIVKDAWPALVSREQFFRVQAILSEPDRLKNTNPGRPVHLLSGLIFCGGRVGDGQCGARLTGKTSRGRADLRCATAGHVTIPGRDVEDLVIEAFLVWASDPEQYGTLAQRDEARGAELDVKRGELAEAEADLAKWEAMARRREISPEFVARVVPEVERRIQAARVAVRRLEVPSMLEGPLAPGPDVRARWALPDVPIEARRHVLRAVLQPGVAGRVVVYPLDPGQRRYPPPAWERVRFEHDG